MLSGCGSRLASPFPETAPPIRPVPARPSRAKPSQARPGQARYAIRAAALSDLFLWSGDHESWNRGLIITGKRAISVEGMRFTGRFDEIEIRSREGTLFEREREREKEISRPISIDSFARNFRHIFFPRSFAAKRRSFTASITRRRGKRRMLRSPSIQFITEGEGINVRIERVKLLARTGIYTYSRLSVYRRRVLMTHAR